MPVDEEGHVIDFQRDVVPIFRRHCLECHEGENAKADFRIHDPDSVFSYVEGGELEYSSLYVDYLISEYDDMLMPPRSHGGPLAPTELAVVRLWIEEGADWPEDAQVIPQEVDEPGEPVDPLQAVRTAEGGFLGRLWTFQGFFHPATVHFPIALLLLGAVFVVLGWRWPTVGTQVPLACLLLGAASSIVATAMGWSFATEMGYGSWSKVDLDGEIFWHRWSAVVVTVASTVLAVVALMGLKSGNPRSVKVWKIGLLVVAGLVGLVGHQGGEMTYGKDFYPKAFRILLGQPRELIAPDEDDAEIDIDIQVDDTVAGAGSAGGAVGSDET